MFLAPRTILEHFKGALLQQKECFGEVSDVLVERNVGIALYCIAQWLECGTHPPAEELALHLQRALLLGDQVAHGVAERGDVVFRFRCALSAFQSERRKLAAQSGEWRFAREPDGISACVQCDGRLSRADKGGIVF